MRIGGDGYLATRRSGGLSVNVCWLTVLVVGLANPLVVRSEEQAGPRGFGCPGSGDCFSPNGTPGCNDADCCDAVCAIDDFCCDVEWDIFCAQAANVLCAGNTCFPSCGKQNVECLVGSAEYANRQPVGILRRFGSSWCTAWIIAEPNILMTNQHCMNPGIGGMTVEFNFECDQCVGGSEKPTLTYTVSQLIRQNAALDYALIRVNGNPAADWGIASVDGSAPTVGQGVYEIHHGNGQVKGYDEGQITSIDQPGTCIPGTTVEIGVNAVATGGSSGSPIFSSDTHCVVGICHCGPPCQAGFGVPMSAILPDALPHILNAGGTISTCMPCPGADGNLNGDATVDGDDIQFFVSATIGTATLSDLCHGDFSGNGSLGVEDIAGMVAALLAP